MYFNLVCSSNPREIISMNPAFSGVCLLIQETKHEFYYLELCLHGCGAFLQERTPVEKTHVYNISAPKVEIMIDSITWLEQ